MVTGGVVDPSIFGADEDVPSFLDRRHELVASTGEANASASEENEGVEMGGEGDVAHGAEAVQGADHGIDGNDAGDDGGAGEWSDDAEQGGADSNGNVTGNLGGTLDHQAAAEFEAAAPEEEDVNERAVVGHNNPPPEPLTKEQMLRDFNRDVASYGKDSGKGASALPRLGLRVIRAAYDGLISNEKPKNGAKSDAVRIYEAYTQNDSKHAEHTKGGMKANAAKLNALIGLGAMVTVDGVEVANRAVDIREKMESAEAKPKALFAGLVDVARAQMGQDTPLTDAQIEEALGKTQKEKTLAGEWEAIHKKVEKLISGENNDNLKDDSDRAEQIYGLIQEHLNNFGVNEQLEKDVAWLMERGMSREEATELASRK